MNTLNFSFNDLKHDFLCTGYNFKVVIDSENVLTAIEIMQEHFSKFDNIVVTVNEIQISRQDSGTVLTSRDAGDVVEEIKVTVHDEFIEIEVLSLIEDFFNPTSYTQQYTFNEMIELLQ